MQEEWVYGERFVSLPPTPLLSATIDTARRALEGALARCQPGATVLRAPRLDFGDSTVLSPSLAAWPARSPAPGGPRLVVEFRTESTSRYVLGPKRMVYTRQGVPEFWFVDPVRQRVARMTPDRDWPPLILTVGDEIATVGFPGARVACAALLAWPADRIREPERGEPWLEW